MIKKKELYEHVTLATGLRKREVREATDTLFAHMRAQLLAGEEIQCPPLGKIRIIVQNEGTERERSIYRLVLSKDQADSDDDDATDDEDAEATDDVAETEPAD